MSATGGGSAADSPLQLEASEGDVVAIEAVAFARAVPDPAARAPFERLAAAARAGAIPQGLVAALETMLELLFEKGRPSNRAVLQAVYGRTPRGSQRNAAARDVNRALKTLTGHQLQEIRLSAAPGGHTLVVETDRVRLTLEIDSAGARVSSLETG